MRKKKNFPQGEATPPAALNASETPTQPLPPEETTPPAAPNADKIPTPRPLPQGEAIPPAGLNGGGRRKKRLPKGDDGRTIAEMNVEGMPWYNPTMGKVKDEDKPTRKERRAMIGAGYLAYLPAFIIALVGFTAAVLIIYLWLHGWTF